MAIEIERIGTSKSRLGESVLWHSRERSLYWVDCMDPVVSRLNWATRELSTYRLHCRIAALAFRDRGGLVLALQDGITFFEPDSGKRELIVNPEPNQERTQPHDAKVDARGRFIVGSMDRKVSEQVGALYSLDRDLHLSRIAPSFKCTNGPCWSPDAKTFYVSESFDHMILAYDYDLESGALANRRVFVRTDELGGIPDGSTVDAQGRLWAAMLGAGKVACFTPQGQLERVVPMPDPLVSSVAFGGENLDILFATTAGAQVGKLSPAPDGGGFYAIYGLDAKGRAEPYFAG